MSDSKRETCKDRVRPHYRSILHTADVARIYGGPLAAIAGLAWDIEPTPVPAGSAPVRDRIVSEARAALAGDDDSLTARRRRVYEMLVRLARTSHRPVHSAAPHLDPWEAGRLERAELVLRLADAEAADDGAAVARLLAAAEAHLPEGRL